MKMPSTHDDSGRSLAAWGDESLRRSFGLDLDEDSWLSRLKDLADALPASPIGKLGAYELLEEIGRGGQGVVYKARQPHTGRLIAVKRVSAGVFATPRAKARFEREIETAAALDHPGIVTVYGSEVVDQQPVLMMQWIDGVPFDRWAAGGNGPARPVRDVLTCLIAVCDAVQHAHRRGVIHRDLKPTNILVDGADRPHVLDFGLALLSSGTGQGGALTITGELLGTPAYAAPEQLRGSPEAVDVRTDVFSLGAVLFHALTGQPAVDVHLPLPRLLENLPNWRAATPSHLRPGLDRDLDAILLKALHADPEMRYGTVEGLRADIQRHLEGDRVLAHTPSLSYRARKYVRRHRRAVAAVAVIALLLVTGTVVSSALYLQTEQARRSESRQKTRALKSSAFLSEMLTLADPARTRGQTLTVRQMLDEALRRLDAGELSDQPVVEADIRATLGATYMALGLYPQANAQLRRAEILQLQEGGEDDPALLRTQSSLAECLLWQSDQAGSVELARRTYARQCRVLGEENPDTLRTQHWLGNGLTFVGPSDEAERTLLRVVELRRRVLGRDHPETADSLDSLGMVYTWNGRAAEAEPLHRESLEIHLRALGADHPTTLYSVNFLASALVAEGKYDEAEKLFRDGADTAQRVLGEDHLVTLALKGNWAGALVQQGKHTEAQPILSQLVDSSRRVLGEEHSNTLGLVATLGRTLMEMNRFDESEALLRDALDLARKTYGPAHHDTSQLLLDDLAKLSLRRGDLLQAEARCRELLELRASSLGKEHPHTREALLQLVDVLRREGKDDAAAALEATSPAIDGASPAIDGASAAIDGASAALRPSDGDRP